MCDRLSAQSAAGTAAIFDHEWLAETSTVRLMSALCPIADSVSEIWFVGVSDTLPRAPEVCMP